MCGFAGCISKGNISYPFQETLEKMSTAISYRGPDDHHAWCEFSDKVGFAHRRLAIVDLSDAGRQPMESPSGRYVIAFNGEIYNHLDLRKKISNVKWKGHSDTETLVAGFDQWGIVETVKSSIGMFAAAVWDKKEKSLILFRDRLGEKPLYYGWQKESFIFGSELKALKAHPDFSFDINRDALSLFIRHNYIPAPYSIWKGIQKLEPGTLLRLSTSDYNFKIERYWSSREVAMDGVAHPFKGTPKEAVDHLENLLMNAVGQQMVADVSLGAFLSGGIDSSAIVSLMQAQSAKPVKTFTIGFDEKNFNEAEHAKRIAHHLKTDHNELYVSQQMALDVVPNLPYIYDEPFADSSQIPTYLISKLARKSVTVSLSGDGGDELFCGYNRYQFTNRMWNRLSKVPKPLRCCAAGVIEAIQPKYWDKLGSLVPKIRNYNNLGDKLHKGAGVLSNSSANGLYFDLISHYPRPDLIVLNSSEPRIIAEILSYDFKGLNDIEKMMAIDLETYLPDDILVKIDRAAMANSLEGRVPFLDHRVVEFAWKLPLDYKLKNGQSKWPLREILYRYVPRELIERPKMGFGIPLEAWLRGALRDWCEELLNERTLASEGYFNTTLVRGLWAEHISGKRNRAAVLWNILMFQAWKKAQ